MTTATRTNRFAGPCVACKRVVPAETGVLQSTGNGWKVFHGPGGCDAAAAEPQVQASIRVNRFAGSCTACGGWVDAGAGRVDKTPAGWRTSHLGDCPVPAPVGIYRDPDGTIWRVRDGRGQKDVPAGQRRRYAARLVNSGPARLNGTGDAVRFDWERDQTGALYRLTPAMLVPLDDAQTTALMIATGQCIACDAALYAESTMARVRETGIMVGPVCRLSFAPANAPAPEYTEAARPA